MRSPWPPPLESRVRCADRAEKRAAKAALKAALEKEPETEPNAWRPIKGAWCAMAADGRGHVGGDGAYLVPVPLADFGGDFPAGGQARFTAVPGGEQPDGEWPVINLPAAVPASGALFTVAVSPAWGGGRAIMVMGLEVRDPM